MATFTGYFYIEDLGLTTDQRQTIIDTLKAWGVMNDCPYPNLRNHWAVRPDGLAMIFEAAFDDTKLTATWMQSYLATLFGVKVDKITYTTASTIYGPAVTYKYLTVNKLRLGIFGGVYATWAVSHEAVLLYLSDYRDLWQGTELP